MRLVEAIALKTFVGRTVTAEEGDGVRPVEAAPKTVVGRKVIAFQLCGITAGFVGFSVCAEEGVVGTLGGGKSDCPGT